MSKRVSLLKIISEINKRVAILAVVVCIATLIGFFDRFWWPFELLAHFRIQYFVLTLFFSCIFFFQKKLKIAFILLIFAIINFSLIIPFYFNNSDFPNPKLPKLRAMFANLRTSNTNYYKTLNIIKKYKPDFWVVEEINAQWLNKLYVLTNDYPHYTAQSREDNFGIGIFSKISLKNSEIVYIGKTEVPSVVAQINFDGKLLTIFGTHPLPPTGKNYAKFRNNQLEAIPEFLKRYSSPIILIGDLNVTPWSYYFKRLLKDSNLIDSSKGRGIQPTWPTMLFPLLIPIDHCLHSQDIIITDKKVGENIGSDHYPLIIDFQIK